MHLIYIDDSKDQYICVFSAIAIPVERWREAFDAVRQFRRDLRRKHGIYVYKELHAWKLVSGRGRIADGIVTKWQRCQVFTEAVQLLTKLPECRVFNVCFPRKEDERAFERLANRINRTLKTWDSYAVLFCDRGKEMAYTKLLRRMGVFNPIPSQYGGWGLEADLSKNIPIERIVEDPVFKPSSQSYFVQLADFVAYALLRRERPLPSKTKYGIDKVFDLIDPILVKEATRYDPQGIIRP